VRQVDLLRRISPRHQDLDRRRRRTDTFLDRAIAYSIYRIWLIHKVSDSPRRPTVCAALAEPSPDGSGAKKRRTPRRSAVYQSRKAARPAPGRIPHACGAQCRTLTPPHKLQSPVSLGSKQH